MRPLLFLSLALCSLSLAAQSPQTAPAKPADANDIYADSDNQQVYGSFSAFGAAPVAESVGSISTRGNDPRISEQDASSLESIVPDRLVVFYRGGVVPANATAMAARAGAKAVAHMQTLGLSSLQVEGDTGSVIASLRSQPEVTAVLHDRYVHLSRMVTQQAALATPSTPLPQTPRLPSSIARPAVTPETDSFYETPQGWATIVAGGYGKAVPGGPATGPWNTSMGAGVRIAVLDSGVDPSHPDIAPNLVLSLSEVQQAALPSVCDDGSPTDQSGHGTFTASLAAGAQGMGTGMVIGVAPQASLLNIKVVERLPATGSNSGTTAATQCEAGSASGLLSWVLQGIQDAISNHANVINASLGTLIDSTTSDGAGWIAQMNAVTYAAAQAGVVFVSAAGNDGLDLSTSKYVDLPGQARNVLDVVASTNPACAQNLYSGAVCAAGPVTRAYYSDHGANLNAIAAPGGSLPGGTTFGVTGFVRGACANGLPNTVDGPPGTPGQSFGCFSYGHTPYVQAIGTSAAAPLVAGAAAVLKAAHPSWTPTQIISALQSTATVTGNMTEPLINLPAALALQTTP